MLAIISHVDFKFETDLLKETRHTLYNNFYSKNTSKENKQKCLERLIELTEKELMFLKAYKE